MPRQSLLSNPARTAGALALALALELSLPACTLFDDYLSGTPFTLDQPEAAVTLEDRIYADPIAETTDSCVAGGTVFWGRVRNTGDITVEDVFISIDVFDPADVFLGSFRDHVVNGNVTPGDDDFDRPGTILLVGEAGYFNVCATVPFGSVGRTEYRTEFVVINTEGSE